MWNPTIQAAHANAKDRFTIALGDLAYDEPFSAILSYDGAQDQPWSRVDVAREIVSVNHVADGTGSVPVALSNEGDVYTLTETVVRSKIPGAGVQSDDAAGLGAVHLLMVDGDRQTVIGDSRQLYGRTGSGPWQVLSAGGEPVAGYQPEGFGYGAALGDGTLLIAGHQRPAAASGKLSDDPRYTAGMNPADLVALMAERRTAAGGGAPITNLYHVSGADLRPVGVDSAVHVRDVYADPSGRCWVFGVDGLILNGRPEDGLRRLDFHGDASTLLSGTMFQGDLIVASDHALHRFDGHMLSPLKPMLDPKINRGTPTPNRLQTVDDVMVYFDYKHGVCHWDGETWDWVTIPAGLLERAFKSLEQ